MGDQSTPMAKLPWKILPARPRVVTFEGDDLYTYTVAECEQARDAAYIVKAVNAHSALVEALNVAFSTIHSHGGLSDLVGDPKEQRTVGTIIRAALLLVEGE